MVIALDVATVHEPFCKTASYRVVCVRLLKSRVVVLLVGDTGVYVTPLSVDICHIKILPVCPVRFICPLFTPAHTAEGPTAAVVPATDGALTVTVTTLCD